MYLDQYGKNPQYSHCKGKLVSAAPEGNRFTIRFDEEDSNYYDKYGSYSRDYGLKFWYDHELTIQSDRFLGQRVSKFKWSDYYKKEVLSVRDKDIIQFISTEDNKLIGIVSLVNEENEWGKREEEVLWSQHLAGVSNDQLSKLFAREEAQIANKIVQISRKLNSTPLKPRGIDSFLTNLPDGNYIIGASTRAFAGGYLTRLNGKTRKANRQTKNIIDLIDKKIDAKDQGSINTDKLFSVNLNTKEVKDCSSWFANPEDKILSLSKSEIERLKNSIDDDSGFLRSCKKQLRSDSFYVWIRLEDFNMCGQFNAYYYAISSKQETINSLKDSRFQSDFLRYIVYLKSQQSYKQEKQLQSQEVKTQIQNIKTAISAIMSRNLSHNLGSHYLYYTKKNLEEIAVSGIQNAPDIRGAAKVLEYIQARMDYLATIVSNDKYPYGAVNFKSQIYDELTIDDFSKRQNNKHCDRCKRTTNFLLSNLIKSENFTRPDILKNSAETDNAFNPVRIQVKFWKDEKNVVTFTGSSIQPKLKEEKGVENELSKLNIALPGGAMSCHAFFNIVENFIRNSAKYCQEDFRQEGLLITIAIKKIERAYDFVIYDNKNNSEKVLDSINAQLANLKIIEDSGRIEKSSKGLKEMLFSTIWMRSYQYTESTFSDIIYLIQTEKNKSKKLSLINKYGFKFVSVNDNGSKCNPGDEKNGSLGIQFALPAFFYSTDFDTQEGMTKDEILKKAISVSSDIICFKKQANSAFSILHPTKFFTRCYFYGDEDKAYNEFLNSSNVIEKNDNSDERSLDVFKLKSVLDKRFIKEASDNMDSVCLVMNNVKDMKVIPDDKEKIIYFETHFNTRKKFDDYSKYAYVDTISGGNFTTTLRKWMEEGLDYNSSCEYKSWDAKWLGLKIKESALTRITIIDERLYNSMRERELEKEYSYKNLRILNFNLNKLNLNESTFFDWEMEDVLEGNSFRDSSNRSHFLSIHLGVIDKIVDYYMKRTDTLKSIDEIVNELMLKFHKYFCGNDQEVFISIHSGRGNFSKELEGALASYPFMSLAAIENAFNNSKYLLSQLFYSTIYIGKGEINP